MRLLSARLWRDNRQPYRFPAQSPYNPAEDDWAPTPTYDGSGQVVHPSVVDFRQESSVTGGRWRGWRYWMAMTPYPYSNDDFENPSILVSNDGYQWRVPAGVINPIYPPPDSAWSADTDLAYDPETDELVLCYLRVPWDPVIGRSADGVTWGPLVSVDWPRLAGGIACPVLVRMGDGWRVWINSPVAGVNTLWMFTTDDLLHWGPATPITGFKTWHFDIIHHAGQFWAITGGDNLGARVASSLDGVSWAASGPILPYDTWTSRPYRVTIQPHEDGARMRIWASSDKVADNYGTPEWRVYYTQAPLAEWPAAPPA